MFNIFLTIFFSTLAFAFVEPFFFIGYLISIAIFGLYQAIFMANAGGAWDNAKKVVEVDLKQKGTALHDATVVGDTVGDPFKDTSSVALNPVIKFTTLFGLLAVELAVSIADTRGQFGENGPMISHVLAAVSSWHRWCLSGGRSTRCESERCSRSGDRLAPAAVPNRTKPVSGFEFRVSESSRVVQSSSLAIAGRKLDRSNSELRNLKLETRNLN